jgi:hypothetical protein
MPDEGLLPEIKYGPEFYWRVPKMKVDSCA